MTKGNAWAEEEAPGAHFDAFAHTLTRNELSVRTAKALTRYAAALSWFTGKQTVDLESVRAVWPYCTWHKLTPSEKLLQQHKVYANDRIGFAQHTLEQVDLDYAAVAGAPALLDYAVAMEAIGDDAQAGKRRDITANAISSLCSWQHPYGITLAKHLETEYNEKMRLQH